MAVAPGNTPWFVVFERPGMIRTDADRVIPRREPLVTVGIGRGIEDDYDRFENLERLRLVGGGELVGDLHRRLEPGRFVAVDRGLEERHGRALRGNRRGRRPWRVAGVGPPGQAGPGP